MKSPLFAVYGAGGFGRSIMPLARAQLRGRGDTTERLVFIDDAPLASVVNGQRVLSYQDFITSESSECYVVLAISDGSVRERLAGRCTADGIKPWAVTANSVVMMDDVVIGEGATLSPFVTLTSNIRIGHYFQANAFSYVGHDCVIGNFVTFDAGVHCSGNTLIEDHVHIESGSIVRQGVPGKSLIIGCGATVRMGSVVTENVPEHSTVAGNPAMPLK